jgi:hypothetical protein
MRIITALGCLSVGWIAASACGGESSRSGDEQPNGEAGAPPSASEGGAAGNGSGADPGGAAGDSAGAGEGGAVSTGGSLATGGKATGGIATGGVATGGVTTGGAPNMDPIAIPEGCERDNSTEGSGSCNLGFTCNDVYHSVFCNEGAGDDWKCYCMGLVGGTYSIRSETSGAACAVAGAFCAGRGPDLGELPVECEPTEKSDSLSCSRQLHCEHLIDLEEGTAVVFEETSQVSCSEEGVTGIVYCSCGGEHEEVRDATLLDIAAEDACGPALSLCNAKQRKPAGPRACEPESLSASPGQCGLAQGCAQPLELDDGTVVSVYSSDFINCATTATDQSRCDCSDDSGTFTFDIDAETTIDSCTQAGQICSRRDEIEAGEDVACTIQSQSVSGNVCSTELNCSQSGTLGDIVIARQAFLLVSCSEAAPGWACSCSAAGSSVAVDVEADDVWDACSAASDACPGAIDIF